MDDKKVIELNTENLRKYVADKSSDNMAALNNSILQTNPIVQKMLFSNDLAKRMKFKLKDLFR